MCSRQKGCQHLAPLAPPPKARHNSAEGRNRQKAVSRAVTGAFTCPGEASAIDDVFEVKDIVIEAYSSSVSGIRKCKQQ